MRSISIILIKSTHNLCVSLRLVFEPVKYMTFVDKGGEASFQVNMGRQCPFIVREAEVTGENSLFQIVLMSRDIIWARLPGLYSSKKKNEKTQMTLWKTK